MGSRILVADTDSTWAAFEAESLFVMAGELQARYGSASLLLDISRDGALSYVAFAVPGGYVVLWDESTSASAYDACCRALSEQCPGEYVTTDEIDECSAWAGFTGYRYVTES